MVKNGTAISEGKMATSELGIKATGTYELEVSLEEATPYFSYMLTVPAFFPQNQKVVAKYGADYATTSAKNVYNGPYKLAKFDGPGTDTAWSYVKNDTYWDKDNVKTKKINVNVVKEEATALKLYNAGKADDITLSGELAQQNTKTKGYKAYPMASTNYLEFNQKDSSSPFTNINVRKAISYSINRKAIVNSILGDGSTVATGLVAKGLVTNPKTGADFTEDAGNGVAYNKKKAKAYWKKAQKELGIDSLSFKLLAGDSDSGKKISEYLQGALEENLSGVKVEVDNVPEAVRISRANEGDFDVVLGIWQADYADASNFTDLFISGNSHDRGKYDSKVYNNYALSANSTDVNDPDKRYEDLINAEKTIMKDLPISPLWQGSEVHLRNPKVKGILQHSAGTKWDYKYAYVD